MECFCHCAPVMRRRPSFQILHPASLNIYTPVRLVQSLSGGHPHTHPLLSRRGQVHARYSMTGCCHDASGLRLPVFGSSSVLKQMYLTDSCIAQPQTFPLLAVVTVANMHPVLCTRLLPMASRLPTVEQFTCIMGWSTKMEMSTSKLGLVQKLYEPTSSPPRILLSPSPSLSQPSNLQSPVPFTSPRSSLIVSLFNCFLLLSAPSFSFSPLLQPPPSI